MVSYTELPMGVDLSNNNGRVSWKALKNAGVKFAFLKATEGNFFQDDIFLYNVNGANEQEILWGAYHYARPEYGTDAREEADYFINYVEKTTGGLQPGNMLSLDMEVNKDLDFSAWNLYWMEIIESYVKFLPIEYTSRNYIHKLNLASKPKLGQYGLWLADWYKEQLPAAPEPWSVIAFWQQTDKGQIPGISGSVDINYFNGPEENIKLYGMLEPQIEKPPTPELDVAAIKQELLILENQTTEIRRICGLNFDRINEIRKLLGRL